MKKFSYSLIVLTLCFLLSSFSFVLLYPFRGEEVLNKLPDENTQKLYAVIDAFDNYVTEYDNNENNVVEKLVNELSSNMIVDYETVYNGINNNNESITVTAMFIDSSKVRLKNDTDFLFSEYKAYSPRLSQNAMKQINNIINNTAMYTKEFTIRVSFKDSNDSLHQKAVLNQEDLNNIKNEYYEDAQRIYKNYIDTSDVSTAFLCESIKELPLDNVVDIFNNNNEENQINEDWQKDLFMNYAEYYLDSLIIENILKTNTNGSNSKGTINYEIEDGNMVIDNVCKQLLNTYYINKQTPIDKLQVINDFAKELSVYKYSETSNLVMKTFNFSYSHDLNEFTVNDDFYKEIVDDIYEEFINFEDIFNRYYPTEMDKYFFVERPFAQTTTISDNTGDNRYRQLNIKVTGSTDCYIKLYYYDSVADSLKEIVFAAYIKQGDSLQIFIPEGDYIFKYATGTMWYGDIHKFSDEGQYYAGSDVISVHEYMMTTTIELGNIDSGSIPTYSQTPDTF